MSVVVVAPAPFKGAVSAGEAARAIGAGLRLAGHETRVLAAADGGEGTMDALVAALGGRRRGVPATDPLGRPTDAAVGRLPGGTVVVEMAQASGWERLSDRERDPEATTSFGTGQLIRAALDLKASRIVVGVGGSATTDAGLGIARALGARVLDADGHELEGRGAELARVATIDLTGLDPRVASTEIVVACDVDNPLLGEHGAARVFAPQKGADRAAVERLEAGMASVAALFTTTDVHAPGAGAAGGAAAGMAELLGARLTPGAPLVLEAVALRAALEGADLCVTGEGRLDEQSLSGKAAVAVARVCRAAEVPCVALCGQVGLLPGLIRRAGFAAAFPVARELRPLPDTLAAAESDLAAAGAALGGLLAALPARRAPG
jgi:glycerate kinase